MEEIKFFTFVSLRDYLFEFSESYNLENFLIPPDQTIRNIKKRHLRVCRFCKKKMPETTFRKEAHVVPELLGNKYLICDFECDNCNKIFSTYENDLANWLGLSRTILGVKGKKSTPNFQSARNEITTDKIKLRDLNLIKVSKKEDKAIITDGSTGKTTLKYTKQAYTPIRIYKSLLKIAISLISEEEISQYDKAVEFLISGNKNELFSNFAKMIHHQLPPADYYVERPIAMLFSKKNNFSKIPKHVFVLNYANNIYSFPLPFNQCDINNGCYKGSAPGSLSIKIIHPPPLLFDRPIKAINHTSFNKDLGSNELVIDDEEIFEFEIAKDAMKNIISYNPETGETKDVNSLPDDITAIMFGTNKIEIPLKD